MNTTYSNKPNLTLQRYSHTATPMKFAGLASTADLELAKAALTSPSDVSVNVKDTYSYDHTTIPVRSKRRVSKVKDSVFHLGIWDFLHKFTSIHTYKNERARDRAFTKIQKKEQKKNRKAKIDFEVREDGTIVTKKTGKIRTTRIKRIKVGTQKIVKQKFEVEGDKATRAKVRPSNTVSPSPEKS
jgi:hypothetical protein